MNIDIKTLFPRASQSFIFANRIHPGLVDAKPNQNAVQPIVGANRAKHEANHQRKIQDSEPQ